MKSPGWKVITAEYIPADRNWRCDVSKDTQFRTVYCYEAVKVGQEITLARDKDND